jgi:hypothetical protein
MTTKADYLKRTEWSTGGTLFFVMCPDGSEEMFHDELCADEWIRLDMEERNKHEARVAESLFHKYHTIAQQMRDDGYAVVFWTPEELEGIDCIDRLEERITELGNETIEYLKG